MFTFSIILEMICLYSLGVLKIFVYLIEFIFKYFIISIIFFYISFFFTACCLCVCVAIGFYSFTFSTLMDDLYFTVVCLDCSNHIAILVKRLVSHFGLILEFYPSPTLGPSSLVWVLLRTVTNHSKLLLPWIESLLL